jgi:hypothetical protein
VGDDMEGGDAEPTPEGAPPAEAETPEAGPDVHAPTKPPAWEQDAWTKTTNGALILHVTLPGNVVAGDTIVVAAELDSDAPLQVTDSRGEIYHLAAVVPRGPLSVQIGVWYAIGVAAGTHTVSLTFDGITVWNLISAYVHAYSGISALDAASWKSSSNTTAMSSGAITTTAANDLLFGFAVTSYASPAVGFQARRTDDQDLTEDCIVPTASTVQALATATKAPWAMVGVAFRPLAAQ